MPTQFSSEAKKIIRSQWAKPLLAFLHDTLGKKLFYLGLPDSQAFDIHEWIDYLDVVYAFQCRDYPKPSDSGQSREKIIELENVGLALNRRGKLSDFQVFDGYIEEVILRGYDNSPTPKEFIQNEIVTVYNLDFCSQIASPITYLDKKGNVQTAYKFNAVRKLMEMQMSMMPSSKKFVMFLTIHCSYSGEEFTNFQSNPPVGVKPYIDATSKLTKGKKAPYWLKAFVYHSLVNFFTTYCFIPEFLPVVHYSGDNDNPLLFFTIVGTQDSNQGGVSLPLQSLDEFLNGKFVSVDVNETLVNNTVLTAHDEKDWSLVSSLHLFKSSKTYNKNWKDTK